MDKHAGSAVQHLTVYNSPSPRYCITYESIQTPKVSHDKNKCDYFIRHVYHRHSIDSVCCPSKTVFRGTPMVMAFQGRGEVPFSRRRLRAGRTEAIYWLTMPTDDEIAPPFFFNYPQLFDVLSTTGRGWLVGGPSLSFFFSLITFLSRPSGAPAGHYILSDI